MGCSYCGDMGARNGEYCTCAAGQTLQIRNGDYELHPKLEKALRRIFSNKPHIQKRLDEIHAKRKNHNLR